MNFSANRQVATPFGMARAISGNSSTKSLLAIVQSRARAFTLVEIMIVVAIIAVVLAMGMPSFVRTVRQEPLRKAVGDLVDACAQARAQAILKGLPAELRIRASDGQLIVASVQASSDETDEPTAAPGDDSATAPLFLARLHDDIAVTLLYVNLRNQIESEETSVHFFPNGTSDELTIVLQSGTGIRKISLECITGLPNVESIR